MTDMLLKQQRMAISSNIVRGLAVIVLIGLIALALGIGYIWFSGGNGQASAPITAPQLDVQPGDSGVLFQIVPEESEVRFRIDETLIGEPKMVIGTTNQVAGDLLVNFENPEESRMGLIRVNVRTLTTDNSFRNRALRGQILEADKAEYEFAEFVPTELIGLPEEITIGEAVTFQIAGQLTAHGVSQPVVFDASVTVFSDSRLEGTARTNVFYRDFNITIPEAPGVANISDDLQLEIDFVARAVEGEM